MYEEWRDNEDILQVPRSTVKALITSKSGWLDQVGRQLVDICVDIVGIGIISCGCRHVSRRQQNDGRPQLSTGWRLLGDLLVVQEPQPHRNEGAFGRTQAGRKHKTCINVINSSLPKIPYGTKPYFTLTS